MGGILLPIFSTVAQVGAPIPPESIPNLSLWYNPDENTATKVTVNGSNEVTQIIDLSGAGHPANSLNARYPDYATNVLNGLGAVQFNGVDDNSDINPIAWAQSLPGFSVYAVIRPTTISGAFPLANTNTGLGIEWNGTAWQVNAASGVATPSTAITNDTSRPHIYGMIYDGTATGDANRLKFRYDRVPQALTFTASPGTATSATASTMYFCSNRRNAPTAYMTGYLFEVLIWLRTLNSNEIQGVENYIRGHWRI